MLNQILAVMLFIILVNSLKRLTMGIPARLTSWGLFILILNGFLVARFPLALGVQLFNDNGEWERLIVYSVVLVFNVIDWLRYDRLPTKEKRKERSAH